LQIVKIKIIQKKDTGSKHNIFSEIIRFGFDRANRIQSGAYACTDQDTMMGHQIHGFPVNLSITAHFTKKFGINATCSSFDTARDYTYF